MELVPADLLDEIGEQHVALWEETWMPQMLEAAARLGAAKAPKSSWPQDLLWNWRLKTDWAKPLLGMRSFCIVCEKSLEGMMMVNLTKTCHLEEQRHKELAYIEFISTAPWNRAKLFGVARYYGVGKILVRAAIELSLREEFEGRIGLHSLPQADDFYRRKCKMSVLGVDAKKENLTYFEMTPEQAKLFLEED
ncbi:MAG TPA: GNAT family N-acetyltransferase [Verrucomicrobiae bacterium]|nr:GNAT family N-acetyltransferase [Verrucomicrobiae bacterium]